VVTGWLTYSGQFTHTNGHLSATGRAQERESSPAKDRRSTAVPCNQITSVTSLQYAVHNTASKIAFNASN